MLETQNRSSHLTRYHLSTTKVLKVFDIPKLFEENLQFYLEIYPRSCFYKTPKVVKTPN